MIWERKHTNTHQALMPNHQLARKPSVPTCGGAAGAGERVEDELEGRWPEMKGEGGGIGTPTLLHICPRPTPFLQTHRPPLQTTCTLNVSNIKIFITRHLRKVLLGELPLVKEFRARESSRRPCSEWAC